MTVRCDVHLGGLSALGLHRIICARDACTGGGNLKTRVMASAGAVPSALADRHFCQIKWPTSRFLVPRSATLKGL